MRLGGSVEAEHPEDWIKQLLELGYKVANLPKTVGSDALELQDAYMNEAHKAGVVMAEVGAWSNPISTDDAERLKALQYCKERLAVAERIGAKCCVNIAGSKGAMWDGPHPDNLTEDMFTLVVDTVRSIIDSVKPKRTFYTLESMPWIFPYV